MIQPIEPGVLQQFLKLQRFTGTGEFQQNEDTDEINAPTEKKMGFKAFLEDRRSKEESPANLSLTKSQIQIN